MNMRIIKDITEFVFVEDVIQKADAIFIPGGSWPEMAESAAKLWREGYAPIVVPSGGFSIKTGKFGGVKTRADIYNKQYLTECDFLTDVLVINGVAKEAVIGENKASFTQENAVFTSRLMQEKKINISTAIICCKNFHARRALMYYQFAFPEVEFYIHPSPYHENGIEISRDNWYMTQAGTTRVLGEIKRYGMQFDYEFEQLRKGELG